MRRSLIALSLFFTISAFGKDVFFPIAGTTSGSLATFRTDVRLFNPSSTKAITVSIYVLPVGTPPRDNSAVQAQTKTIGARQMMILNDVVSQLGGSGLDAIRISSADDFVGSERVYAQQSASSSCNIAGTLGQDVPALDPGSAKKQGVLLALKATSAFRSNIGVVNPGSTTANVTFRLYDKNSALVSTGSAIALPPMGVIGPTNMTSGLFFAPGSADLSDAWVSYTSDQPVIAYASVIDNATTDPTFIAMAEDTGSATTPSNTPKTFAVTTRSWAIDMSPVPTGATAINQGDIVTFTVTGRDAIHGLEIDDPDGQQIFNITSIAPGQTITKGPFTFSKQGTYNYYCTVSSCGSGANQHSAMFGQIIVGSATDTTRPGY